MAFCTDCQTNLDDVPVGHPCPNCGGTKRSVNVTAGVAAVSVMAGALDIELIKGDHRPWTEKWQTVTRCLESLREVYQPSFGQPGNDEIERRVNDFFVECDHVRDWIKADVGNLPGITTQDIEAHCSGSIPLQHCRDICNSHKHGARYPGQRTARIRKVSSRAAYSSAVTMDLDWDNPNTLTVDALDLAEDCVKDWRDFFKAHNIIPPT